MKITILALTLSAALLPAVAAAQTRSHTYVTMNAGVNRVQAETADATVGASPIPEMIGDVSIAAGPAVTGAVGRQLHERLRAEIEGDFRSNGITGETGFGDQGNKTGHERKYGAMGNVLYDFATSRLMPYAGAGIGVQFVHEPAENATDGPVTVSVPAQVKSSFAYQAIAGMALSVGASKRLAVTAEYRYLGLVGTRTYTGTVTIDGIGTFPLTDRSNDDNNHSVLFGVRYAFGR